MKTEKQDDGSVIIFSRRTLAVLWKKKIWIALVSVLCAVVVAAGMALSVKPMYQADILMYVNNHKFSLGSAALTISSGELTAARQLLDTYMVALKSRTALDTVIEKAGLPYSREKLAGMISAGSVNNTEWFTVKVTAGNPEEARIIADTIAEVLPEVLAGTIEGSSVKVLDYAVLPQGRIDSGSTRYAVLGFIMGFVVVVLVIILKDSMDDKIQDEETLTEVSAQIPVLATIPHKGGGSHYSRYGHDQKKKSNDKARNGLNAICGDLDFAQTEAYNLLQTSVQYSFSGSDGCKVVGITSSERNEGKSTLAINLAYSLSVDKKRVLLLEGDMRLPSIAKKLGIESKPGLSDYLTGKAVNDEGIQYSEMVPSLAVICAGVLPPNPFRLLGSESMKELLQELKQYFDYIIVDLPPVNIVSDPLAIAKYLDGFVVVARNEYSTRKGVADVIKKLCAVNANILGFALNFDHIFSNDGYGKYSRYRKYEAYEQDYETGSEPAIRRKGVPAALRDADDNSTMKP